MNEFFSKDEPIFPIRTAAKMLGVSIHTLRMYEREGLIIPNKSDGNQRIYSQKDIDRISFIRKAINESKISINGIKAIYSLIPCWKIKECPDNIRNSCRAKLENFQACWSYKNSSNFSCDDNCNECEAYKKFTDCTNINDLLKKMQRK